MSLPPSVIPSPGEVWMCDFAGYVAPEMVKLRRVVVVSPRNAGAPIALVVPVSTTPPEPVQPIHVHFPRGSYACFGPVDTWAKADLLAHVRFERLDRVRVHGRYIRTVSLSTRHLHDVRRAVLHAIGLGRLASYL